MGLNYGCIALSAVSEEDKDVANQKRKPAPPLVGQVLKEYRKTHGLTQEELAFTLKMEPRTFRAYENERPINNIQELRRIADVLGIEPERLGIAASLYIPKTAEQIEEIVGRAWSLMDEVRVDEARAVIEKLVRDVRPQITTEDHVLLRSLAHAYHAAGYIVSMSARTNEVPQSIAYYHQMECIARIINDQTLLNIALTYQGDMYRRLGDMTKAINYLEAANDTTPKADIAARGNSLQLLGRAYLPNKNIYGFESTMAEAEKLAHEIDPEKSSTRGHYNIGTIYEEYGKSYAAIGQIQKAMEYIDRAEIVLPRTPFWDGLLMIGRAEALIYGGEINSGKPLAIEAATQARMQGHHRRLERIYGMKRYLHQQSLKFSKAEMELSDALEGPTERWDINS